MAKAKTKANSAINNVFPLTNPVKKPITNVLYVVDRSGSMRPYWNETKNQLRGTLEHLREEVVAKKQEVRVTVVSFSDSPLFAVSDVLIDKLDINSLVNGLPAPSGNTALWATVDSEVQKVLATAEARAAYADNAYLVNILTDGDNNEIPRKFQNKALADSDNWTFTAACPPGYASHFRDSGFDADNVIEWAGSEAGAREYGEKTRAGLTTYMTSRAAGIKKSSSFYVDASKVDVNALSVVVAKPVEVKTETRVREFAEEKTKQPYVPGTVFYRLDKPEKLQDYKKLLLWHKKDKKLYGDGKISVKSALNLNATGEIRINPGNHGDFDIFVQSGSFSRILPSRTKVVLV